MRKRVRYLLSFCDMLRVIMDKKLNPAPGIGRRTTIVTISERAGVSHSTVTRALRGDTRISEATRTRIVALAKDMGYTANAFARTLSSGKSGLFGLVLGSAENPFYTELFHEAARQAELRGCRLLIIHAGGGPIEEKTAEALLQYQVDGCIISSAVLSSRAAEICATNRVPLVMVNRVARSHGCVVTCDNFAGGAEMAELFLKTGRRRFALVTTSSSSSTGVERTEGFRSALANSGAQIIATIDGHSTYQGGFDAGERIARLRPDDRPDAVFAVSDIIATGVLDAFRLHGLAVPRDIAVAGFDDLTIAARKIYDLTTIQQPLALMIERAFDMLQARVKDGTLPDEFITLRGKLIVRGSMAAT